MTVTFKKYAQFSRRIRDVFETHQSCAAAAKATLFYRLDDVQGFAEKCLERGDCPYCREALTVNNFVVSHRVPPSRGGRYSLRNLTVSCRDCWVLRGALDEHEFRELLQLIAQWPRPMQIHFRKQLGAGASLVRTALPVCGSLEWFTGSELPHAPLVPDEAEPEVVETEYTS